MDGVTIILSVDPLTEVAAIAGRLRQHHRDEAALRAELLEAMLEARRQGRSLAELAHAAGLTRARVSQLTAPASSEPDAPTSQ